MSVCICTSSIAPRFRNCKRRQGNFFTFRQVNQKSLAILGEMAKMRASPALGPLWEGAVGEADWGREILMPSLPPSPCGRHLPHRGRQRDADCHDQCEHWLAMTMQGWTTLPTPASGTLIS